MFEKGKSGNPAGRPKQKPYLEWCRAWTAEKAPTVLAAIAENPRRKDQLQAILAIMAYGIGKPVETQVLDAELAASPGIGVDELGREIAALVGGGSPARGGSDSAGQVDPAARAVPVLPAQPGAGEVHSGDVPPGGFHRD